MSGILGGINVVDFSRVLAGPFCTMMLGDLGAEVIKVEQPAGGDDTRSMGPPQYGSDAAFFMGANRNKRSITLDLATAAGQAIALELVDRADIVVENFLHGTMEKFGLGYATLAARNRRLIMLRISAFGTSGPLRDRPGYDLLAQAMTGLMKLTGEPGGPPLRAGYAFADLGTGLYGALATLAALIERERSGRGQYLTTSLFETQFTFQMHWAHNYFADGLRPIPLGTAHPNLAPYQAFAASDGHFVLAVANDAQFRRLARALGRTQWLTDERFLTNRARVANRADLVHALEQYFAAQPRDHWIAMLAEFGVPAGPVLELDEAYALPQTAALEIVEQIAHPVAGSLLQIRFPVTLEPRATIRRPPPLLGEHTAQILSELGLDQTRINTLAHTHVTTRQDAEP